jgi:6-phosphogluconolactonase (cycloisomerase 2 family)
VDSTGSVYVSYFTDGQVSAGTNVGSNDIVVFKMDTDGSVLWVKQQAAMSSSGNDSFPSIAVDSAGSIYVSYQTVGTVSGGTNKGSNDIVIFKMDPDGIVQWINQQSSMSTSNDDLNPRIAADAFGNLYVSYYTTGSVSGGLNIGSNDIVVMKFTSSVPFVPVFLAPRSKGAFKVNNASRVSIQGRVILRSS